MYTVNTVWILCLILDNGEVGCNPDYGMFTTKEACLVSATITAKSFGDIGPLNIIGDNDPLVGAFCVEGVTKEEVDE